ncbi:MAG: hypothetical protein PHZ09_06835 [Eubacteriales bacterium]|nr:hypothetical protein [Eubacteriales bacterium]
MKERLPLKLISLLLLLVVFIGSVSCASGTGDAGRDTAGEKADTAAETKAEDTRLYPDLPDDDFEGYDFKVLHWYVTGWDSRRNKDIYAEAENGDPINDAVYRRNMAINERYNVTFSIQNETQDKVISMTQQFIRSGEDAYDLVYGRMVDIPSLLTGGSFIDFHTIPHINLDNPWWDQNSVEKLSVLNKLYIVASDINIIDKDATASVVFNKKYAQDYNFPDLYEIVEKGEWTMDTMMGLYKDKTVDLDGNGIIDENDMYGFLGKHDVTASFYMGGGGTFVSKDEDDIPQISFESERNYDIAMKVFEIIYDKENFYNQHLMQQPIDDPLFEQMFPDGHGLFYWTRLDGITSMRASETEFGILPIPKYNVEQANHINMVSIHTSGLMTVPKTATNIDRTGIVLEALAAESKYTLIPAYIDTALKGKYVRDSESEAMLDLIFANRVYDLGDVYGFGGLANNFLSIAGTGNTDVASFYQKYEKATVAAIDKFIEQIESFD